MIKKSETGQSLVEMAISTLLLAALIMLVIDGGRALLAYTELRSAAEEGAVYASFHPGEFDEDGDYDGDDVIEARIRNSATSLVDLSDPINVEVQFECGSGVFTATLTHHFYPIMPGLSGVNLFNIVVSAQSTILTGECP